MRIPPLCDRLAVEEADGEGPVGGCGGNMELVRSNNGHNRN